MYLNIFDIFDTSNIKATLSFLVHTHKVTLSGFFII